MEIETIKIYSDGSCLGNPGPGGYAAILTYKEDSKTISGSCESTTNNRMELLAVIEALRSLKKDKIPLEIYLDSVYVKDGITKYIENWEKNGWKTSTKQPVKNQELWMELISLCRKYKITWHWVKGHADNHMNNLVDKIARKEATNMKENLGYN